MKILFSFLLFTSSSTSTERSKPYYKHPAELLEFSSLYTKICIILISVLSECLLEVLVRLDSIKKALVSKQNSLA